MYLQVERERTFIDKRSFFFCDKSCDKARKGITIIVFILTTSRLNVIFIRANNQIKQIN